MASSAHADGKARPPPSDPSPENIFLFIPNLIGASLELPPRLC